MECRAEWRRSAVKIKKYSAEQSGGSAGAVQSSGVMQSRVPVQCRAVQCSAVQFSTVKSSGGSGGAVQASASGSLQLHTAAPLQ